MASNGLLLFTSTRCVLSSTRVKYNLQNAASRLVAGVLYVYQWLPGPGGVPSSVGGGVQVEDVATQISRCSLVASRVYCQAQHHCPRLDVRCLYQKSLENGSIRPSVPIDLVMVERNTGEENTITQTVVRNFVSQNFRVSNPDFAIEFLNSEREATPPEDGQSSSEVPLVPFSKIFNRVVLGGTFDRMHNAHKILLTESAIRCQTEIVVGVTDDDMVKKKTLYELIEPCVKRQERVTTFLQDLAPHISSRVVPISDPFGPTITEKDMDLLVVSAETIAGGQKINQIRKERDMPQLEVHAINVYADPKKMNAIEEDKISSSSQRIRMLGDRLKPPLKSPSLPYIIGLTGGTCCGKTSISRFMEGHGVPAINCDLLGHDAYKEGTKCFQQVIETFGEDVLCPSGNTINRKALAKKVFASSTELAKLNSIVWPEIKRLMLERIQFHAKQGAKAVILDAAILLEANWDNLCHDLWVTIIPKEEAIRRVQSRDKVSQEDAERRVGCQVSNHERAKRATFLFSTLWEEEFTQSQVLKAWGNIDSTIKFL
ncbi:Bifunctional coenzyme A synthase [Orchesella cincta]|uniref:Bifunctional coenzyme A synthase n=1 Tax=Orchesella cincta TaxID=48709 RepID=A0A1D2N4Z2_ORCCI|nr:Bifunctional coenzyme A synthase [Orchesella cincta]